MVSETGLVVSERPKCQLMMVIDPYPMLATLSNKPAWMEINEWVSLLVFIILATDPKDDIDTAWYKLIDRVYSSLKLSLENKRIVNCDPATESRDRLVNVAITYRTILFRLHPLLSTVYPQIRLGYKIRLHHIDSSGCYLLLTRD